MSDKMKMHSKDLVEYNIQTLLELFPNVGKEIVKGYDLEGKPIVGKGVDFEALKQELMNVVIDEKEERYQFSWPEKKKAIVQANTSTNRTLRPIKKDSVVAPLSA